MRVVLWCPGWGLVYFTVPCPGWRAGLGGQGERHVSDFISALTSHLACGAFSEEGRRLAEDLMAERGAKSLNVWAPVTPETSKAHHHQPRCQLRHVAARRPLPKWPLWEGPSISFLIHSASVHYSPPVKEAEGPRARAPRTKRDTSVRSSTFSARDCGKNQRASLTGHFHRVKEVVLDSCCNCGPTHLHASLRKVFHPNYPHHYFYYKYQYY